MFRKSVRSNYEWYCPCLEWRWKFDRMYCTRDIGGSSSTIDTFIVVQSISIISMQVHNMNEREEKSHLFCQRLQRGVECNLFPGTAHQELCCLSYIVHVGLRWGKKFNTMEDPPERLTSKGAFVDVVKDDRACSCCSLCFNVCWSKCCWCFFSLDHYHWPSRYSPTSSYFERSSTRVTCNSLSADSFKKTHLLKNPQPKGISWQTLKFPLSQRTTSSLLSSRRFGVAIGKRTTC